MKDRRIFGAFEQVTLPEFSIKVMAKVDTGAWNGALHCTDIVEKDGQLTFSLLGDDNLRVTVSEYEVREVRSASGHLSNRYVIPTKIQIQGETYDSNIGLSDRSDMRKEMLIGRRFLIRNNILVDVSLTKKQDDHKGSYIV
jgi:hypothetical protein